MNEGTLTNKFFITAENVTDNSKLNIIRGNERVVRARLQDALFFYEEDIAKSIDFFQAKLAKIIYQEKIGSILDKSKRITKLADILAVRLGLNLEVQKVISEIAKYSKMDLATNMVSEFPELQGYIGEQYALKWGIPAEIASGLSEYYLPAFSGDKLPEKSSSAIVSLADKMDNIATQFYLNNIPSGSQDPFALRRQALGVVRIIAEKELDVNILELIKLSLQGLVVSSEIESKIMDFFKQRIFQYFNDNLKVERDIINSAFSFDLFEMKKRVSLLNLLKANVNANKIVESFVRVRNIVDKNVYVYKEIDPFLFEDASERVLFELVKKIPDCLNKEDKIIELSVVLAEAINDFFEAVMVMTEDVELKNNRLNLLALIGFFSFNYGDLIKLD